MWKNFDDVLDFGDGDVIYELFSGLQMELSSNRTDAAPALKPLGPLEKKCVRAKKRNNLSFPFSLLFEKIQLVLHFRMIFTTDCGQWSKFLQFLHRLNHSAVSILQ